MRGHLIARPEAVLRYAYVFNVLVQASVFVT